MIRMAFTIAKPSSEADICAPRQDTLPWTSIGFDFRRQLRVSQVQELTGGGKDMRSRIQGEKTDLGWQSFPQPL
jgi:hypothetical protein